MKYFVYEYKGEYEDDGGGMIWNQLANKHKLKDANGKILFFKSKKEVYRFMTDYRGPGNIYNIEEYKKGKK